MQIPSNTLDYSPYFPRKAVSQSPVNERTELSANSIFSPNSESFQNLVIFHAGQILIESSHIIKSKSVA